MHTDIHTPQKQLYKYRFFRKLKMNFGDGTREKPRINLKICEDINKNLSQFKFQDKSLICNVCQERFFTLNDALIHWRETQCSEKIQENPDCEDDTVELRPEIFHKTEQSAPVTKSDFTEHNEEEESFDPMDLDPMDDKKSNADSSSSYIDEMEIKPEIFSDESDVEDSKEDLKHILPKEEALAESDNAENQDDDRNFDQNFYDEDGDHDITNEDNDDYTIVKPPMKEEDDTFKIRIRKPTAASKPKKRKLEQSEEGKAFVCEYEGCNYRANFQTLLRRHIVHVHEKVRYNCAFCDVKGIGVDGLRKHVKGHHPERPWIKDEHPQSDPSDIKEDKSFTCDIESCDFIAPNRWTLKAHKETHQTSPAGPKQEKLWFKDEDDYVCKVCHYKSKKPGTTRIHIERHHGDRTCFHCDFKCNDIEVMKDHIKVNHNGEETKCDYCVKTFASREGLKRHERLIHEEQTRPDAVMQACDKCTFTCYSSYRLRRHIRNVHKWKELDCKFCDKRFNSLEGLSKHQKLIHEEEINPGGELLFCDQCDYSGYGEFRLKRHQANIHREHPLHKCEQCDYSSPRPYSLRKHIERVHMGIKSIDKHKERCAECNFECKNRKLLNEHMVAVHNMSLEFFYCDECTFSSVYKSSLDNHKRLKHGEVVRTSLAKDQTFYCDYCEFSSKYKVTVNNHINSKHLGIKFQCDLCDYSCSSQQMLGWHTRGKHGPGWPCSYCSYKATQPGQLTAHVRAIHEKVKFQCKLCSFATGFSTNLSAHMKKAH